jgi:hypothetical protein
MKEERSALVHNDNGSLEQMPLEPTDQQVVSASFSLRHDFGLLPDEERMIYQTQCRAWWRAIAKEMNNPSQHPLVISEVESMSNQTNKAD